jgi:uridine kinase
MTKIILIAGGTASGKTTIANIFSTQYDATLLPHDRYYKDIPRTEDFNFDEPDALDNQLLVEHIKLLKQGLPAPIPIYDFPSHKRVQEIEMVHPKEIIIVEGILTLAVPQIRELGDLLVYVNAPDDLRLVRRLKRDVVSRGRDVKSVLQQYLETVRPMHQLHISPSKVHASIELDGTEPPRRNAAIINKLISN